MKDIKRLKLMNGNQGWYLNIRNKIIDYKDSIIQIDSGEILLTCEEIAKLQELFYKNQSQLQLVTSKIPETIVSAKCLGVDSKLDFNDYSIKSQNLNKKEEKFIEKEIFYFHQGTLRSGELLETSQNLFILGDVNPGAIVSSNGDVKVWGRLLGIAHAGKSGRTDARISALELRPVQLRIADKIARGPEEKPQRGFAEEAQIESGVIIIKPARAN